MLVMSRKRDEVVVISAYDAKGNPIQVKVMVVDIRGDKARLGFDAPKDISCHRLEIQQKIEGV